MSHLKIGTLLINQGLITKDQLHDAIAMQKKDGGRIGENLVKLGYISEMDILAALGKQLNLPLATPENQLLSPQTDQGLEKLVPYDFAKNNLVLPLSKKDSVVTCAVEDPADLMMLDNLKMLTAGCEVKLVIASRKDLLPAIQNFYAAVNTQKMITPEKMSWRMPSGENNLSDRKTDAAGGGGDSNVEAMIEKAEEAPVIKLVDLMIRQAIEQRASDIHIEPFKDKISLRFRIDGLLYQIPPPNRNLVLPIVSRLKILSKLDIAEKRLPQDGAISFKYEDRVVDLRISTIPTIWGEKVVMRILDKSAVPLELDNLGAEKAQLDRIKTALQAPYGLFFVTGPTGSGKSTTLYATLNETIDPRKNIMTAEDPVEFKLDGINQVSIRSDIGLTFASALRSFLRQDPDVIMVGEVRDLETAQICVRAALTGHLVLSTLHTNDAASAITRLMDMGIEPYLLTPSLIMIIAQRLARRLCPKCKEAVENTPEHFGKVNLKADLIYKAVGCEECNNTGYRGRVVLTEAMLIDDTIRDLIAKRAGYMEIQDAARKGGMSTLYEDGLKKVESGVTSLDEVISVTSSF